MGVGQLAFAIVAGHGEEGGTCPVDEGELAEELLDLVADAYDRLLQSRWGDTCTSGPRLRRPCWR
jgi:hypothetical protein